MTRRTTPVSLFIVQNTMNKEKDLRRGWWRSCVFQSFLYSILDFDLPTFQWRNNGKFYFIKSKFELFRAFRVHMRSASTLKIGKPGGKHGRKWIFTHERFVSFFALSFLFNILKHSVASRRLNSASNNSSFNVLCVLLAHLKLSEQGHILASIPPFYVTKWAPECLFIKFMYIFFNKLI